MFEDPRQERKKEKKGPLFAGYSRSSKEILTKRENTIVAAARCYVTCDVGTFGRE